jgi:putative ABC transport system permease protein
MRLPLAHQASETASDAPYRIFVNKATLAAMDEEWQDGMTIPFGLWQGGMVNGISSQETSPLAGVLTDFPYKSLREPVEPLFYGERPDSSDFAYVVAEVAHDSLAAFQAALPAVWQQFTTDPPEPSFVDDYVANLYTGERKLAQLVTLLAGVALFVACLGLFGLAAHAAQTRRKEIGVRKVLGAGVASLVGRLSREFALLVAAAFTLAAPLAYLATQSWLAGFVERTDVGPGVFALVLSATLVLALATVSYHAWTAATRNPADVLRDE